VKRFQLLSALLVVSTIVVAQSHDSLSPPPALDSGSGQRNAGSLHRWIFGDLWRDAWKDLSLHTLRNNEARTDIPQPDDSACLILPSRLRAVLSPDVRQDLLAAYHPYASRVALLLLNAIGVGVPPADPRSHHSDTIGTESLLRRVRIGTAERVDAASYLQLRLADWFLGNDVEDASSWKWVADTTNLQPAWSPIRHDVSRAFARFDGLFSYVMPMFLDKLPDIERSSFAGEPWGSTRQLDRRILPALDRSAWDSVAARMTAQLADSVISSAVGAIPPEVRRASSLDLLTSLRHRRDALADIARQWYGRISETVDVFGSDEEDLVEILWKGNDGLRAIVKQRSNDKSGEGNRVTFNRIFEREVTSEIRIHLLGGNDLVVLRGEGRQDVRIVILGGDGDDEIVDEESGRDRLSVRVYDDRSTRISGTSAIRVRERPADSPNQADVGQASFREDRGARVDPGLMLEVNSDVGVLLGAGPVWTKYGLFDDPYALRMSVIAGYSPFVNSGKVVFESNSHSLLPGVSAFFRARASGVERVRFFGFGNEEDLPRSASDEYYRVSQTQYRAEGGIRAPSKGTFAVSIGGMLAYTKTHLDGSRWIDRVKPFGVGGIMDVAVRGEIVNDTRDVPFLPSEGNLVQLAIELHPAWLDLSEGYGKARVDLRTYLPFSTPVEGSLCLREHGEAVWGRYPYYAAAFLGGGETLRGYYDGRFAGDAAFSIGSELRITVGTIQMVMPTKVGVTGFAETGQVRTRAVGAGLWHASFGGGLWAVPALRDLTMSLLVGCSRESTILLFEAAVGM
jgi:hypothetical protein